MVASVAIDTPQLKVLERVPSASGHGPNVMNVRAHDAPPSIAELHRPGGQSAFFASAECAFVDDEAPALPIGRVARPTAQKRFERPAPEQHAQSVAHFAEDLLNFTAARMSAFSAFAFTLSPS